LPEVTSSTQSTSFDGLTHRMRSHVAATFAVMSSRSLARVSARPLLTAWPDVAALRQVSACWWSRLLVAYRRGGRHL
jgi:hypothetical protein